MTRTPATLLADIDATQALDEMINATTDAGEYSAADTLRTVRAYIAGDVATLPPAGEAAAAAMVAWSEMVGTGVDPLADSLQALAIVATAGGLEYGVAVAEAGDICPEHWRDGEICADDQDPTCDIGRAEIRFQAEADEIRATEPADCCEGCETTDETLNTRGYCPACVAAADARGHGALVR